MERLRALLADAGRYLSQLTKRERLLLALAGASVVIFVGSVAIATVRSAISTREAAIAQKEQELKEVAVYAGSYAASERARRGMEGRLGGPPLLLMTHLQKLADQQGLTIGSMNDRGSTTVGQVKESVVELQIASTPLDKLTALLDQVERDPHVVKVKNLRVQRLSGGDKALNVSLTVATYSLAKGG